MKISFNLVSGIVLIIGRLLLHVVAELTSVLTVDQCVDQWVCGGAGEEAGAEDGDT